MTGRGGATGTDDPTYAVAVERLVDAGLSEDVGSGDWTSRWIAGEDERAGAVIVAGSDAVVAGTVAVRETFRTLDPEVEVEFAVDEGDPAEAGEVVARVEGLAVAVLGGERTALNFLGRLSGIATATRRFVEAVEGTGATIVDTRKTAPGWRLLEKAAVRAGGGANHRIGLYDMVMVKDNHIAVAGGLEEALRRVRERNRSGLPVVAEVRDGDELAAALEAGVERILLDHMSPAELRSAVERAAALGEGRPRLEASGDVTLENVREIAATGVDFISVGALTHSAPAADFSLRVEGR